MKYFLGLQIVQNKEGIFISQTNYLKDLLKRFGLETCKPIGTPMVTRHKLSIKNETPNVEQKKYKSMIGGLQYLTHTILDIENAVRIVARFQADPKEYHYATVKRIFRYLKGTYDYMEYGMIDQVISLYVHKLIQIVQAVWMTKIAPVVKHFFLGEDWFLG